MRSRILTPGFFVGVVAAANCSTGNITQPDAFQHTTLPCDALLAAGLGDRVLLPTDAGYEPQIQSWYALNGRLHPWCLVLPRNTSEVSLILTTLLAAGEGAGDWHIALRSGGHSMTGGNNIINGVTIDLTMMNGSYYDESTNTASIQPGGRWENVYADLERQGVTVAGGRDGDVGVGGFLLGGGISFYSERKGFGCDTIVNYEVVLANGSIVSANQTAHSDLYKALKGGSSNFGIVTRFDLEAIPSKDLFYDLRIFSSNYSDVILDTIVDYANHNESLGDNTFITFSTHDPSSSSEITMGTIYVNIAGDGDVRTSFDNVKALPAYSNSTSLQTMAAAAAGSKVAGGTWAISMTITFKNDPEILRYAAKIHEELVSSLGKSIGPANFTTMVFFQPLPSYLGQLGQQHGGNMLGLERLESNAVLWTLGVSVASTEGAWAIARTASYEAMSSIKKFAQSVDGDVDLVYLNYADAAQDPLGSYGTDNVQFLREVAAKYDSKGAFQKRIPGGFKLDRVI